MKVVEADELAIASAATMLREGGLVGMPTETVYGIAANALNVEAVRATFAAKGRPAENPLIAHVSSLDQACSLVTSFPEEATLLAGHFWPGPLTLVLPKRAHVPDEVTAGLDTVAIRMPAHPVALRLIELAASPVSAPSANPFMSLSPTTAQMISPDVAAQLSLILDGGPCLVGIESTVLDLSGDRPAILRPGDVSQEQIEAVLGKSVLSSSPTAQVRSPGQYSRHYAPRTDVRIVERLDAQAAGLVFGSAANERQIRMSEDAHEYAKALYLSLYTLDALRPQAIYVEAPPRTPEWQAVWDRLTKASGTA